MRKVSALLLGFLLPLLGFSGIGQAQSSVQVQGTIQAVDCRAQTLVLSTSDTSNMISTAPYTAVLVNSTTVPFCALQEYIGAPVTAWLLATGSEFTATRIDVVAYAAVTPLPPPAAVAAPLPIAGIVLGTIAVAGLGYLLVRDHDRQFYRYPYYGPYYQHYYRPGYRPYGGPYPPLAPIIYVSPVIAGVVLGTVVVGGLPYLLAGDHDGRFYRYPYYGPYHAYYYRPGYRPYHGPHFDAPLRQGDPKWDAPARPDGHNQWSRGYYEPGGAGPPAYRDDRNHGNPGYGDSGGSAPVWRDAPRRSVPAYQDAPRHDSPHWDPSVSQNGPRRDASNGDRRDQRCWGRPSDHPCSDDGKSYPGR